MKPIQEALQKDFLFFDGAMGTQLQAAGLPAAQHPESYNLTHPEAIIDIHRRYLDAGANVISACTFGAYSHKMGNTEEIISAAMANARAAINGRANCFVALDMGPTGRMLVPVGDTPFDTAYDIFKETAMLGARHGADCVIIETMMDLYEMKAAVLAVKENTDLPVFCSFAYEKNGRTLTGGTPLSASVILEGLNVDAIGVNCGAGPDFAAAIAEATLTAASVPVMVQPNAGLPKLDANGGSYFDLTASDFAQGMARIAQGGARVLGGCCGTTPAHIAAMVQACKDITPVPLAPKTAAYIATNGKVFCLDGATPAYGIITAADEAVITALQDGDMYDIADMAIEHKDNEADILVLRIGAAGVDEAGIMPDVINAIQQVAAMPMQIETANPAALEAALRTLSGKAAVCLLSDDALLAETARALVAQYGGVFVKA